MDQEKIMDTPFQSLKPPTLVMKFGGTSVGTAEAISQVVKIVRDARETWPRLVVITSALAGVTNLLLEAAKNAENGEIDRLDSVRAELTRRHDAILDALIHLSQRRALVKESNRDSIG